MISAFLIMSTFLLCPFEELMLVARNILVQVIWKSLNDSLTNVYIEFSYILQLLQHSIIFLTSVGLSYIFNVYMLLIAGTIYLCKQELMCLTNVWRKSHLLRFTRKMFVDFTLLCINCNWFNWQNWQWRIML